MSKSNGMSTTLAIKPVINHTAKTIIVSEKFMNEASVPFTAEFNDLTMLREALPGYEVITRSHRKPRTTEKTQNIKKFVPYDKMVAYINLLPERDELLKKIANERRAEGVLYKDVETGCLTFKAYNRKSKKRWRDKVIRYLEHGWVKESKERIKVYESIPKIVGTAKVMSALDREIGEAKSALMVHEIIDRV